MQLDKFYGNLKLGVFLSFFLTNIFWFLWYCSETVIQFLRGTFLEGFGSLLSVVVNIITPFLTYISLGAFVLISVTLFIVFMIDVLNISNWKKIG